MLDNIRTKEFYRFSRIQVMEAMKIALRWYKETKDEQFLELAKKLGLDSQWYKEELEKLR